MVLRIKNKTDLGVILGGARFSFSWSLLMCVNNKLYNFPCSGTSFVNIIFSPGKNTREITNLVLSLLPFQQMHVLGNAEERTKKERTLKSPLVVLVFLVFGYFLNKLTKNHERKIQNSILITLAFQQCNCCQNSCCDTRNDTHSHKFTRTCIYTCVYFFFVCEVH